MAAATLAIALVAALCVRGTFAQGELYTGSSCTTHENSAGICTVFGKCTWAQQAVRNGGRPKICAFDGPSTPIVCCDAATLASTPEPSTTPVPTPAPSQTTTTQRGPTYTPISDGAAEAKAREKCQEYGQKVWKLQRPAVSTTPFVQLVNTSQCRVPELVGAQPFVIGGKDASLYEFPHMAAVGFGESSNKRWLCGGALISMRYVLTAAHCINDKSKPGKKGVGEAKWVRLGDLNLYSDTDQAKVQEFSVEMRMTHPNYVDGIKDNDIGLLRLDREVVIDEAVRPACLHTNADPLPDYATASGWGAVDLSGRPAEILQKINLPLVSQEACWPHFDVVANPGYKPSLPSGLLDSMMCAGGEPFGGRDTCQGDSGGPLQVLRGDPYCTYTVIGITSFGKSCAKPDTPAVYTRVAHFMPWIVNEMWP